MRDTVCGARVLAAASLLVTVACSAARVPEVALPGLTSRTGVTARPPGADGLAIPPGVTPDDGLDIQEAVAVALWNNADFQVRLTELGFARADLLEAGLLQNPVLSLLFPVGPKQLEATLRWPIEVLWERPRRVAAATLAADGVAAALEQAGLDLVAAVKATYIDVGLAEDLSRLTDEAAVQWDRIDELTHSRLVAGDISQLEARSATIDAARARQEAERARLAIPVAANALRGLLGLALEPTPVTVVPVRDDPDFCAPLPDLVDIALASRPGARAAELGVEEAAQRLGWERARVLALAAVLDANGDGAEGFELGPGIDIGLPLFDRNQAGRTRGEVELLRASRAYLATRQRVATEVREAVARFELEREMVDRWRGSVVLPLEAQVEAAETAYAAGDVSYLFVLEMTRRLTEARITLRESQASLAHAATQVERAVGRQCTPPGKEIARGF